jgi:Bardet-Biedl syndrome 5 protein
MDPEERLIGACETIQNLHSLFSSQPNFGVQVTYEEAPRALPEVTERRVEEDIDIVEDYNEYIPASFVTKRDAYIIQAGKPSGEEKSDRDDDAVLPAYNQDLGCAVQPRPGKTTPASLWALMS